MFDRVTIRNFKSIGDVSVDLEPTTVLIGRSGVGKSNFLRAIRFLRNYLLRGEQAVHEEGGWPRIFPFRAAVSLYIGVEYRLPGFETPFTYELEVSVPPHGGPSFATRERLASGATTYFAKLAGKWASPIPLVVQTSSAGPPVVLGSLPTITEAVLSFAALTNGIGWHDFPANVFGEKASPPNSQAERGLSDAAANHLTVLRDLTQDLRDQHARRRVIARLRQVNPSVKSVELNSLLSPSNVIVTHAVGENAIPLDLPQESDGFRRYYAHLLALYQTPPKQVLMFEEPENGIAAGALRNLSDEFQTAPMAGRGQVLLSTQSPDLLDGFQPEQIRVVDLDPVTQLTRIGRLDPDQIDAVHDHLLEPGELLTVDFARLDREVPVG